MMEAMVHIRRGMKVAADEMARGEIEMAREERRRWKELRDLGGFGDGEIELSLRRIDRAREEVQVEVRSDEERRTGG